MSVDIDTARVRRVLLADGWHAVEGTDTGSSFQVGPIRVQNSGETISAAVGGSDVGFSFVDHHTRKLLAGPFHSIRALELD